MLCVRDVAGEAARSSNYQDALAVFNKVHWKSTSPNRWLAAGSVPPRYSRWFEDNYYPADFIVEREFRVIVERRVTAINLACQLYRLKYQRWPARLEDLLPEFLPEVPKDPFGADGRTIGYRVIKAGLPDGGDRPVLYFDPDPAGPDLGVSTQAMYGWVRNPPNAYNKGMRQYRDLARYVPAKDSAKAVDAKVNQANAPGEDSKIENESKKP